MSSHRLLSPLDTTRYQLPAPTKPENEEEWDAALKNARAQLEHVLRPAPAYNLTPEDLVTWRRLMRITRTYDPRLLRS